MNDQYTDANTPTGAEVVSPPAEPDPDAARWADIACCGRCTHFHGCYTMCPANDPENKLGARISLFGQCGLLPAPLPVWEDLEKEPYEASNRNFLQTCDRYERRESEEGAYGYGYSQT